MDKLPLLASSLFVVALMMAGSFVELRPCETEDDTWCYWDAELRGNGEGNSFISLWEPAQ